MRSFLPARSLNSPAPLPSSLQGRHPDIAKPLKGFGSGVFELALRFRSDAYRLVYAVQIGHEIWVLHAFQKKSKTGIKTPKAEIELIHARIKQLKELLQ